MRLILVTTVFPNPCQPTKGTFNLCLAQALATRHDVHVVSPVAWTDEWQARRGGAPLLEKQRQVDLDAVHVHYPRYCYTPGILRTCYGWFMWRSTQRTLLHLLDTFRPDAILGYWAHPDGEVAVRAAAIAGIPSIVMVGGSDILLLARRPMRRRRITAVLHRADAVVTVSRNLRDRVVEMGIAPGKVHIVERGVDARYFFPGDRLESRGRLGLGTDLGDNILLWVGRMVSVKGLDVLVQACSLLHQRGVPFRLYLVGEGPLRRELELDVAARGLRNHVIFVGPRPQQALGDWYRAANLTLLPSRSEGVPNVLRESLACGTPFVASRVGGIPEIAAHGAGLLVPPGNPEQLAQAIAEELAAPRPPAASCSDDWSESARQLTGIIAPLVEARATNPVGSDLDS